MGATESKRRHSYFPSSDSKVTNKLYNSRRTPPQRYIYGQEIRGVTPNRDHIAEDDYDSPGNDPVSCVNTRLPARPPPAERCPLEDVSTTIMVANQEQELGGQDDRDPVYSDGYTPMSDTTFEMQGTSEELPAETTNKDLVIEDDKNYNNPDLCIGVRALPALPRATVSCPMEDMSATMVAKIDELTLESEDEPHPINDDGYTSVSDTEYDIPRTSQELQYETTGTDHGGEEYYLSSRIHPARYENTAGVNRIPEQDQLTLESQEPDPNPVVYDGSRYAGMLEGSYKTEQDYESLHMIRPRVTDPRLSDPSPCPTEKRVACFVFAVYHPLGFNGLLKLTAVFQEYDSTKQKQELREKSGLMKFGRQIHEDCHYLNDSQKGDVRVEISGFRWQIAEGDNDSRVVQVLKYNKLRDGIMCILRFHFEKVRGCKADIFSANFDILQDGLPEEATTFSICEPIYKFYDGTAAKSSRKRRSVSFRDDDGTSTMSSSSNSQCSPVVTSNESSSSQTTLDDSSAS